MSDNREGIKSFDKMIRLYFTRLSHLTTQIPHEVHMIVLPPYMTFKGFKGSFLNRFE